MLAPGMFGMTSVKELFPESEKSRSLMLITMPERSLYIPKWMAIVLTHEVSHFVGGRLRCRPEREHYVFQIVARVLELEAKQFIGEEQYHFRNTGKIFTCFSERIWDMQGKRIFWILSAA